MYRRDTVKWFKHTDFILFDMICLQAAYILGFALAGYGFNVYEDEIYRTMAIFLELVDVMTIMTCGTMHDVLKRGYYKEFLITLSHVFLLGAISVAVLFMMKIGHNFSRMTLGMTLIVYDLLSYVIRILWKKHLKSTMALNRSLMIISTKDAVDETVQHMLTHNYAEFSFAGIALLDDDRTGQYVGEIPIVSSGDQIVDYICRHWVDEVLIALPDGAHYPAKLIDELTETGVIVHIRLTEMESRPGRKKVVEKVSGYNVVTTTVNYASTFELFAKRLMDIAGGLVGCLLTCVIFIFVAPAIELASPGPVFYTHERVGLNGKRFKMIKFRSMYMDADKRKAELMKQNKITDARMFKMDFDPRVIGNKIMPDGTHKTGIGDFIRRTSLDEFPQFFNVLKGDMSIVGTRPPLPSETALYEPHHHVRLAVKPGITGMWQVSGRSNITNFEEVVKLDRQYIEKWSIGLDIKIILKTIAVVFRKDGSM